ncbi:MAG TPA: hypothetical protein VMW25_01300 [Clostridia bacterium]|nr:hypothetical protein [Clostridia bacterium]
MNTDILKQFKEPVFYITNDVERAIGLESLLPNYHLVCLDDHPLIDYLMETGVSVFCLERVLAKKNLLFRTSATVLAHPLTLSFIKEKAKGRKPRILFFKPQKKLEILAQRHGFKLLGNKAEVNRLFEDKVSFFKLCLKEKIKVLPGEVLKLSQADFGLLSQKYGLPFVIQFGRGWAGSSTFFIESPTEFKNLQEKFGQFKVRVSRFIKGKTVLNNAVIVKNQILLSSPALQIKANLPLAPHLGATAGRQWPAGLSFGQIKEINKISSQVGRIMARQGYQGFFGLDFLIEDKGGEIYLSENNARLTASVPFYTQLELKAGIFPLLGYHLLAFENEFCLPTPSYLAPELKGSEIVVRNCQPSPVKILKTLAPGIYSPKLEFKKESYFLETESQSLFWLKAAAQGRVVNPEIELFKINTWAEVCEKDGQLKKEYQQLSKRILEKIVWEKCKT